MTKILSDSSSPSNSAHFKYSIHFFDFFCENITFCSYNYTHAYSMVSDSFPESITPNNTTLSYCVAFALGILYHNIGNKCLHFLVRRNFQKKNLGRCKKDWNVCIEYTDSLKYDFS